MGRVAHSPARFLTVFSFFAQHSLSNRKHSSMRKYAYVIGAVMVVSFGTVSHAQSPSAPAGGRVVTSEAAHDAELAAHRERAGKPHFAGEPQRAQNGEKVRIRVERVNALASATAKTGMIRRSTEPDVITLQVLETTSALDLAHALVSVANGLGTTTRMLAPEMRAFFVAADETKKNGKAKREQFGRATALLQQLKTRPSEPAETTLKLTIVSSTK